MSRRSWGYVVAGQAAGDLLLGLERADAALREVVSWPDPGIRGEAEHVVVAVAAEFEQFTAGFLLHGGLRPGDAADAGQSGEDGVAELACQRGEHFFRYGGKSKLNGTMPLVDQAAQRPLRLHRPDRARVGLGAVLEIPKQVGVMPISA
jgi:hypothetical protein